MMGSQHKIVGIGAGVAGAILIVNGQGDQLGSLVAFTSVIGCMLPDIDHDRTKIGRKRKFVTNLTGKALTGLICAAIVIGGILCFGFITGLVQAGVQTTNLMYGSCMLVAIGIARAKVTNSKSFKWMAKHRGIMHTLVPVICLILLMNFTTYGIWYYSMLGIIVGYCSHLFADMLTVEGCPILFPITKKNFRFLKLSTSSSSCWVAAFVTAILFVYLALEITQLR